MSDAEKLQAVKAKVEREKEKWSTMVADSSHLTPDWCVKEILRILTVLQKLLEEK